jgi:SAM-dependent methyltransferase
MPAQFDAYEYLAAIYDDWIVTAVDIPFYVATAVESGGPVLELGVGTGRIAIPIAAAGVKVIGVDSSDAMLDLARRKAASDPAVSENLDLRPGDIAAPPVQESFPLVICPFNTMLHLAPDARERIFTVVADLLSSEGEFIFDAMTPTAEQIQATQRRAMETCPGVLEIPAWDVPTKTMTLHIEHDGRRLALDHHWQSPAEWVATAGVTLGEVVVIEGAELGWDPKRTVYRCRKARTQ